MTLRYLRLIVLGLLSFCLSAAAQEVVSGTVKDARSGEPVPGAAVTQGKNWAITDSLGVFKLKTREKSPITITSLGYKTLESALTPGAVYRLEPDILALQEVVIIAQENRGLTSSSKIGADAIAHIQPSSLADVLELLPGGRAIDPALSSPQIANLRSAASVSADYATSALGTSIIVDGKPIGNNANLQSTPAYSSLGSEHVNLGTDLRTVTTEDIESVEVVRGIASVEYGDLTSGLMKIIRKQGGQALRARFKADMNSKLFYVGKDLEWKGYTLNAGLSYLDSEADPRNPRQNYKRLTGTLRGGKTWTGEYKHRLNLSLDYTGSFDDQKSDRNLDFGAMGPVETYKSSYNRLALGLDYTLSSTDNDSFFRNWVNNASLTYEKDLIDRWRYVMSAAESPVSTATQEGEWDALIVPAQYESTLQVDGRPLYLYLSSIASFKAGIHKIKVGAQWTMDKNYGQGSIFDPSRPFGTSMSTRPRPYSDIPANHQLSAFVEESAQCALGRWSLEWALGARVSALAGAGSRYAINFRPYVDPRANLRLNLPSQVVGGHRLDAGVYVGAGQHTKFPTMDMLYPAPYFSDYVQFNYWPVEKELRRVNLRVFRVEPVNYALRPARNLKIEIGGDVSWNGFNFTLDVFRENMTSGFRSGSTLVQRIYKQYDGTGIEKSTLTGPPSLEGLPYVLDTLLSAYSVTVNGSQTLKQGVEFTFVSPRIAAIGTRITANGAWFVTKNTNSVPEWVVPSVMIGGKRYPYAGYYENNDGSTYEALTTNVMADTQIPSLGLILSTSFQTSWYTNHHPIQKSQYPTKWVDETLTEHSFTMADASDPILRYLVREYDELNYSYLVPFAMHINLKVTKKLYHDKLSTSLFVNRLLSISPDYTLNGSYIRRNVTPYFGMEINFSL